MGRYNKRSRKQFSRSKSRSKRRGGNKQPATSPRNKTKTAKVKKPNKYAYHYSKDWNENMTKTAKTRWLNSMSANTALHFKNSAKGLDLEAAKQGNTYYNDPISPTIFDKTPYGDNNNTATATVNDDTLSIFDENSDK